MTKNETLVPKLRKCAAKYQRSTERQSATPFDTEQFSSTIGSNMDSNTSINFYENSVKKLSSFEKMFVEAFHTKSPRRRTINYIHPIGDGSGFNLTLLNVISH